MSDSSNRRSIFLASFMTLIAAGIGFAIRGGILDDWESTFGFTKTELGKITGGGLWGFGVMIIFFSIFADLVGYRALLIGGFVLHVASAVLTIAATPVFHSFGKDATYWCLYAGMFLFALANGLCETAINPLVATLYPQQKTHYLNILHAGWPGGLIIGGLVAYAFAGHHSVLSHVRWEILMCVFLVPTVIYGLIVLRQSFPKSEASVAGVNFGQMLAQLASPILVFLLVIHAMVGYVELGTDSWMQDIMKASIAEWAALLFVYTSGVMFVLRFFAGPIVERTNPLGLLFISSVIGAFGLYLFGTSESALMIFLAGTIYGVGKTFLWPTMLGVVGERFPKGGALAMGLMGGIGMLSAGLLGGPIIGYKQDYATAQALEQSDAAVYTEYVNAKQKELYVLPKISVLDADKVGALKEKTNPTPAEAKAKSEIESATIAGGKKALELTAFVPCAMAVCYLLLLLYFRATGGYKQEHITHPQVHQYGGDEA
ncbi:MAG: MFS transporter [Planctomycetes bacterium]|nr:MFS transporter [Planctomycetota bacterium]